jgi:uncharacterized protein
VSDRTPPADHGGEGTGDPAVAGEPGWYPAETGFVLWWDGQEWGPPRPVDEIARPAPPEPDEPAPRLLPYAVPGDRTRVLVILSHLGFVFGAFIMPLAVYTVERSRPYVRHHATEALNFQLTVLVVAVLSVPLMAVYVGFGTLLLALVADVVFGVAGAVQASRGVWWRYPLSIRFVRP